MAVAVVGGNSTVDGHEPDPARDSTITYVLVREHGTWLITSFQNTRRTPVPGRPS